MTPGCRAVLARGWQDFTRFFGREKVNGVVFAVIVLLSGAALNVAVDGWAAVDETWRTLRLPLGVVIAIAILLVWFVARAPGAMKVEAAAAERRRRGILLGRLRHLYALDNDSISSAFLAGLEPIPKEWVDARLAEMGETWRQEEYR